MTKLHVLLTLSLFASCPAWPGEKMNTFELAPKLIAFRTTVMGKDEFAAAANMLRADALARVRACTERESAAFEKIKTAADWEKFRDDRLAALQKSIGTCRIPVAANVPPEAVQSDGAAAANGYETTSTQDGDGFRVKNLVIAAREGLPITANLYAPAAATADMPGILVVSSHHNSKWQGELQDMGMTWARNGCMVMVIDNIGYGERRQQAYGGREDYRWRYHLGMQLYTAGENLMNWMVADQRRGLDVLTALPGVDLKRIIVIGSVAGGGDLAGVLAATDDRVKCVIPYNYGSASAVKQDAPGKTVWVNYVGGGDWDSVRCLRNKARDGFNNWLIVAACAPRPTVFAKEFEWQPAGDEGFARVRRVFDFYNAPERISSIHGFGSDSHPERPKSGCNNVGPHQRKEIYPILKDWFQIPVPTEYEHRMPLDQLTCLTGKAKVSWRVRPANELLAEAAARQLSTARSALKEMSDEKRRDKLRQAWAEKLGNVAPAEVPVVKHSETVQGGGYVAEKLLLAVEPGISVPAVLLKPKTEDAKVLAKLPAVLAVAQGGKDLFICRRALEIAQLLSRNVAVCVVDVRGTGETAPGGDRFWYSAAVNEASVELMLGQTILGSRVRDLRSVLKYLRTRPDIDEKRIAAWGESFAPVNGPAFVDPPMKTDNSAYIAEPMGATVALLLALYEDDLKAVVARGGLTGYASLFDGPACNVVLDVVVPNILEAGDLADVVGAIAPLPVRLEAFVDGRNRLACQNRLEQDFAPAVSAYRSRPEALTLSPQAAEDVAAWLENALTK